MKRTAASTLAAFTCLWAVAAAGPARAEQPPSAEVRLPPTSVMCLDASGGVMDAGRTFTALDQRLAHTTTPRRRYGVYDPFKGLYRACAAALPGEDPRALGLQPHTIAGGRYAQRRLEDWRNRIGEISLDFTEMVEQYGPRTDVARPRVEIYDSDRLLLLHLPIKP